MGRNAGFNGLPGFKDDQTRMVRLLEQIEQNTRDLDQQQDITLEGASISERMGIIPPRSVVITESSDLETAEDDGSILMEPGDVAVLARYDHTTHAVYAVGATDVSDVVFWLEVDGNPAIGPTHGPLGTVNSPFSFVDNYAGAVPADDRTELKAEYRPSASGTVNVVGRIHVEVVP